MPSFSGDWDEPENALDREQRRAPQQTGNDLDKYKYQSMAMEKLNEIFVNAQHRGD